MGFQVRSEIGGLPDAAIHRADIEDVGLRGNAHRGASATVRRGPISRHRMAPSALVLMGACESAGRTAARNSELRERRVLGASVGRQNIEGKHPLFENETG